MIKCQFNRFTHLLKNANNLNLLEIHAVGNTDVVAKGKGCLTYYGPLKSWPQFTAKAWNSKNTSELTSQAQVFQGE